MAIVRKMIYENEPLTAEQLKQIEKAEKKPIVFDDDCLELTEKQLKEIAAMAAQQRRERRKQFNTYGHLYPNQDSKLAAMLDKI